MTGEEPQPPRWDRAHPRLFVFAALGFAAALACGCFTFFLAAALWKCCVPSAVQSSGNFVRCKLTKHHFTPVSWALRRRSLFSKPRVCHPAEAGRGAVCRIGAARGGVYLLHALHHSGFPFISPAGIDLAKLDMRSGLERLAYAVLIILVATTAAFGSRHTAAAICSRCSSCPEPRLSEDIVFRLLASFGGVFGFFAHVQQSPEPSSLRRPYRCGNEHVPAGAGEPCGLSARYCSVSGRTAVRIAGLLPEERRRLSPASPSPCRPSLSWYRDCLSTVPSIIWASCL